MQIKLGDMLSRLAEQKGTALPGSEEVSEKSGVELNTVKRLIANSRTSIETSDLQLLVKYLFDEFRPLVEGGIGDKQLVDQIRFDLVEFNFDMISFAGADQVELI